MPRHNVVAFVIPRHDAESRKYPNQGNIGKGFSSGHTSRVPLLSSLRHLLDPASGAG